VALTFQTSPRHTLNDQKEMKIDVWLTSPAAQFNTHKKYQPGDALIPTASIHKGSRLCRSPGEVVPRAVGKRTAGQIALAVYG
jgi:hypothetical protein